ncbi:malto-oligosyltrehalose synthase [Jatrophihabitans sp. DSM 45814]
MGLASVPSATYRLQITAEFTLFDAADLTAYLVDLGVSAVYVSPLLRATAGSPHGYDVVDHSLVDPERGGEAGLAALAAACRATGLGLVVDIVPNHMGVADASQNVTWWDLLQHGIGSAHADWFDVDWAYGDGKILIPVLGDDFDPGRDLELKDGELRYYEHRYPIAAGTQLTGETAATVHARQHYRLVNFRRADIDQNYRRFFAVTELAGLRVEDPRVFEATHAEIIRWVREHGVTGIRIDHPDGLVDPGGYLERLASSLAEAVDGTWTTVEKITEPGENLPASWPVAGMTGYDALAEVNALMVDPAAEGTMTQLYHELTGDDRDYDQHIADGKRLVATTILQAEIRRLRRLVNSDEDAAIRAALTELAIAFPVYRSYLPLGSEHLEHAAQLAKTRRPELASAIDGLLPRLSDPADELCARFQQVTGAVMAKGVEDTAYYRYSRLISLNEVGGYPGTFGSGVAEFHQAQLRRIARARRGMTTLSTHDTKRGEDIRARIAVLAELPAEWSEVARRLLELAPVPNAAFGYLLWQTFAATGLIDRNRMHAYAQKAMREAADGTGWIDPEATFESAVHAAVDAAYDNPEVRKLVTSFAARLEPYGRSNSLSQKLIQLTMPGVPDVYQGSELWEDSLVDPDNRRPVDFDLRNRLLKSITSAADCKTIEPAVSPAAAKFWLTKQSLHARRDRPQLFHDYRPLLVDGPAQDYLVAFDRGGAITLATRLPVGVEIAGGWTQTKIILPIGSYTDALTDRRFSGEVLVADIFTDFPVALLLLEES